MITKHFGWLGGILQSVWGLHELHQALNGRGKADRPGATGLLIGVEYSRVRNIVWDRTYRIVTTRIEVGLVDVRKLPDNHWEGL